MACEVRIVRVELDGPAHTAELVAMTLGVRADELSITRVCERCGDPAHGRPRMTGGAGPSFNVSHTDGLALVALGPAGVRVGVDVERVRERPHLDQLARRVLADGVYAEWRGLPEVGRVRAFLQAWTAKEAYLKATGLGIVTRLAEVPDAVDGWTIAPVDAGAGYVGAIAIDRPGVIPSVETAR